MTRADGTSRGVKYVLDAGKRVAHRWLLALGARLARADVRGDVPVAVSITTYGTRLDSVHLCLETIAKGTRRPSRLILWLDDDVRGSALPDGLSRMVRRGLEIKYTPPWRSHNKYYPYVLERADLPLVVADDDIFYPRDWLESLWTSAAEHPTSVVAHRAHRFSFGPAGQVLDYSSWPAASAELSFASFGTGVGGVYYPVELLARLRDEGEIFVELAPTADDVWLHSRAVKHGFRTKQVGDVPLKLKNIPGTQTVTLNAHNLSVEDGTAPNDLQIAACYGPEDIERIRDDVRGVLR